MSRRRAHRRERPSLTRRPGISVVSVVGRARADRWPLALTTLVVTVAAFLACVTPRLVASTGDEALRHALHAAGQAAEVAVSRSFTENPYEARTLHVELAEATRGQAAAIEANLAPALADALAPPVTTFATSPLPVVSPTAEVERPVLRAAHVEGAGAPAVTWLDGGPAGQTIAATDVRTWAEETPVPVELGLSEAVADALDVGVGDTVVTRNRNRSMQVDVVVSGVFRADDPADPAWSHAPDLLEPQVVGSRLTRQTRLAGLASDESLPVAVFAVPAGTTTRVVTFAPDVEALGQDDVAAVSAEVAGLRTAVGDAIAPRDGSTTTVTTVLDSVLLDARDRFLAASAQVAVLLAGVLTATLLTLLVAAVLLVRRRASVIATHRARGATLAGIAVEAGLEATVVAGVGCALGVTLAAVVAPGAVPWGWLLPVAVVAALGAPALTVRRAAAGSRRAVAANRADRSVVDRDRHAGRVAVEVAVVVAAVGALAALRARGVTDLDAARGPDPLLALAPTLAALAGAVLLMRVLPLLLRWSVAAATRYRRAVPVLAAARAHASAGAVLPFLALTVAASVGVFGATVVTTVQRGEVDASWHAVGADATVSSPPDAVLDDVATDLRTGPNVRTAVTGRVDEHVEVFGPWGNQLVRLVVVPSADFAALLAQSPLPDAPGLAGLGAQRGTGRPGVLLSAGLRTEGDDDLLLAWDGTRVEIAAVGTASPVLSGDEDTVVVDRAALEAARGAPVEPNRLWVVGPGAVAAVAATPALDASTVATRDVWLAQHRTDPLTVGVQDLAVAAAVVLALLAVVVVVLAAATSAPHRGTTLAALRTLGLSGPAARTVTAGELLPGALLAATGGVVVGVLLAAVATGPLALHLVTGQPADPRTALTSWVAAPPAVVVLTVLVLVLVESSVRRRERLGQVLRVGSPR